MARCTCASSFHDQITREWLEQEYSGDIRDAIRDLSLGVETIVYITRSASATSTAPAAAPSVVESGASEPIFASASGQLNPRYSFDNYVVGSCNPVLRTLPRARRSQQSLAQLQSPVYLWRRRDGQDWHLMHAIGRERCSEQYPGMRIVYTSSERFMNEVICCIRSDRMPAFHRHYRSADVLLIDDIQILAGKERTQEEFFHTFNELYDHQKQIVISSDSAPKSTPGLVERLRSRFEWGLMVDIQPPDLETKMAILDKKAETEGVTLPDDVRIYIATKTKSNVRELEGALVKLMAYSSVTGSAINIAMAQQVLKYLIPGQDRRVTMDSVPGEP